MKIGDVLKGRLATYLGMDTNDPSLDEHIRRLAFGEASRAVIAMDAGHTVWLATIEPPEGQMGPKLLRIRYPANGREIHDAEAFALAGSVADIMFGWEEEEPVRYLTLSDRAELGDVNAQHFMECIDGSVRYAKATYVYWTISQTFSRLCINFQAIERIAECLLELGTVGSGRLRSIFEDCRPMFEHEDESPLRQRMDMAITRFQQVFPLREDEPEFLFEFYIAKHVFSERSA